MMDSQKRKLLIHDHRKDVLSQLNEFRRSSHLCDVTVVAQGREFPAHRAVLAAAGGFFTGLFATNMREQSEHKIELPQVDPDVVDDVLSYIYTGEIEIAPENAQQIMMAADFLLLEKLKSPVDEFLAEITQHNPPSDCLHAYQCAVRYTCKLFKEVALKLVRKNFEAIVIENEFLELSFEAVHEIIGSDDLVVRNEELVYRAVIDWVKHKEERKDSFYELFQLIRLCSISEEFINSTVVSETLVLSNPNCLTLLFKSTKYTSELNAPSHPHPRHYLDTYTDAILVFPQYNQHKGIVYGPWCYVPSQGKWFHIPINGKHVFGYGLPVYYNGSVYIVRHNHAGLGMDLDRYELNTDSWSVVGYLKDVLLFRFSVASVHGSVYIVGGLKQMENSVSSVYACDIKGRMSGSLREFHEVAPMNESRARCSVVSDNKYLYVLGGYSRQNNIDTYHNSMERYDPESNSWEYLSAQRNVKSYGQCTLANGKIFTCCPVKGQDTSIIDNACSVYDITTDTWSEIPRSPMSLEYGIARACDNNLYLIGAGSGTEHCNNIKAISYNMTTENWSYDSSILLKRKNNFTSSKLFLGGVVVRLPKDHIASLQLLEDADP